MCVCVFGYAAGKKCYVMLLSSLAANREEGSLHCHDVLIANPLRERVSREKRWTTAWCRAASEKHYRLPYKTLDSQTVVGSGKIRCVCVCVC